MRGELDNGLTYDFSARTGESEIQYTLFNTINPSLGDSAGTVQTSFRPSDLINSETQFQADFTYEFDAGLAGPALFAFGGSYMVRSMSCVKVIQTHTLLAPTREKIHGICVMPTAGSLMEKCYRRWLYPQLR